jgi:hypothetical protein
MRKREEKEKIRMYNSEKCFGSLGLFTLKIYFPSPAFFTCPLIFQKYPSQILESEH